MAIYSLFTIYDQHLFIYYIVIAVSYNHEEKTKKIKFNFSS